MASDHPSLSKGMNNLIVESRIGVGILLIAAPAIYSVEAFFQELTSYLSLNDLSWPVCLWIVSYLLTNIRFIVGNFEHIKSPKWTSRSSLGFTMDTFFILGMHAILVLAARSPFVDPHDLLIWRNPIIILSALFVLDLVWIVTRLFVDRFADKLESGFHQDFSQSREFVGRIMASLRGIPSPYLSTWLAANVLLLLCTVITVYILLYGVPYLGLKESNDLALSLSALSSTWWYPVFFLVASLLAFVIDLPSMDFWRSDPKYKCKIEILTHCLHQMLIELGYVVKDGSTETLDFKDQKEKDVECFSAFVIWPVGQSRNGGGARVLGSSFQEPDCCLAAESSRVVLLKTNDSEVLLNSAKTMMTHFGTSRFGMFLASKPTSGQLHCLNSALSDLGNQPDVPPEGTADGEETPKGCWPIRPRPQIKANLNYELRLYYPSIGDDGPSVEKIDQITVISISKYEQDRLSEFSERISIAIGYARGQSRIQGHGPSPGDPQESLPQSQTAQ